MTTHESPLAERWGGWYVTGTHGSERHLGNATMPRDAQAEQFDREAGANVTDLTGRLDTARYLAPDSDLVALMVLEHQTYLHNLITNANYQTRLALHDEHIMDEMLGARTALTHRRPCADSARLANWSSRDCCFAVSRSLPLPCAGRATSRRASRRGTARSAGPVPAGLRPPAAAVPVPVQLPDLLGGLRRPARPREAVRLQATWTRSSSGPVNDAKYSHLTAETRQAIREMLLETKPDLPHRSDA